MSRGPSIQSLQQKLKIKKNDAKILKQYMTESKYAPPAVHPDTALNFANKVMNGYGVEAVRDENIWINCMLIRETHTKQHYVMIQIKEIFLSDHGAIGQKKIYCK